MTLQKETITLETGDFVSGLGSLKGQMGLKFQDLTKGSPWDFKGDNGQQTVIPKVDLTIKGSVYGIADGLLAQSKFGPMQQPIPKNGKSITLPKGEDVLVNVISNAKDKAILHFSNAEASWFQ